MLHIIFISVYLVLLMILGIWKSRQVKTQSDFAVAGRSLTPWVLTGTMLATWIGTGSIFGNAGKTFDTGLQGWILCIGGVLGILILISIAGKVRSFNKFTVPEIIGERYGNVARLLSVITLVVAYMVIVSYQYNAGGTVVHRIFQDSNGNQLMSLEWATVFAAAFIVLYTVLAGLLSVAYTDYIIGITMTIGLLITVPFLYFKAGGWSGIEENFLAMGKPEHMKAWGVYSWMEMLMFSLPPFLLILGDANMYQRFSASKTQKGATQATVVLLFAVLLIEMLIVLGAWIASSMIPEAEIHKHIMIYTSFDLLPKFLGAILLTTIVGIIISTADSYLLVPATTLVKDVYHQHINPKASEKKIVLVSRLIVLALGFIAYLMSRKFQSSSEFFTKALYAYTIYGAGITPALVAALFWKRASKAGAISSIAAGTIITLLWKEAAFVKNLFPEDFYNQTDEVLPAIIISVLCLVVFSLLLPDKKKLDINS